MASIAFAATGRDIMNALKAGKSIMVHAVLSDGTNAYAAPYSISFNESSGEFFMSGEIADLHYSIDTDLDALLIYEDSSSGGGTK